ncbi:MAG TPA: Ig-like domain-containing protein, partial [Vicinamibacterales bacterium]|nr:Ig-like domain-containing protein [Vicinamibacterales bacterium]
EDASAPLTLGGSDVEGAALTYTVVSAPAHGTLSGVAPALVYTPAPNYHGLDSFTFNVNDGAADSNLATVTISVTAADDAPIAENVSVTGTEDTPVTVTLAGSDPEGAPLTCTVITAPAHGTLAGTAPSLTYTPAPNYSGADSFTYLVNDGTGNSAVATVTITVAEVNDAPVASGQVLTVAEDASAALTLAATDLEGDALTYTVVASPEHGTLSGVAPALTYTPAPNYSGPDSFTFRVNDGASASNVATVSVSVSAVNDSPSFVAGADQVVAEDSGQGAVAGWATSISAGAVDEVGQALTFVVTNDRNSLFSAQPSITQDGTLTFTPAPNASGSAIVTVQLRDNGGTANGGVDASVIRTFSISVLAVNDAPAFTKGADQAISVDAGPQVIPAWATNISAGPADEAAQALTFVVDNSNASLFAVAPAVSPDGTLTFTPAAGAIGTAQVTVTARDSGGTLNGGVDASAPQTFTVTIQGKPTLAISDASVAEGSTGGTTPLVFTVSLSVASSAPVTVNYQTLNGTASAGRDYTGMSGTLTFAPGEISKTIAVLVTADTNRENSETLSVRLSTGSVTITRSEAYGTIINDD